MWYRNNLEKCICDWENSHEHPFFCTFLYTSWRHNTETRLTKGNIWLIWSLSFAIFFFHYNTRNSCRCVVLNAPSDTMHPCCSHILTWRTWTHRFRKNDFQTRDVGLSDEHMNAALDIHLSNWTLSGHVALWVIKLWLKPCYSNSLQYSEFDNMLLWGFLDYWLQFQLFYSSF